MVPIVITAYRCHGDVMASCSLVRVIGLLFAAKQEAGLSPAHIQCIAPQQPVICVQSGV